MNFYLVCTRHIYRKWNERLFREMVEMHEAGRSANHPVEFWYQGELGFFDFYMYVSGSLLTEQARQFCQYPCLTFLFVVDSIPLAKKLKDCGVFGVSSGEYLGYALKNREEWEMRGQEVVAAMQEDLSPFYKGSRKCTPFFS